MSIQANSGGLGVDVSPARLIMWPELKITRPQEPGRICFDCLTCRHDLCKNPDCPCICSEDPVTVAAEARKRHHLIHASSR